MNLLEFLKKVILKIKQKSDETYLAKNDPTANVQVKDLTAKNLDLSYTADNGDKKTGKVKSDVTPYNDGSQNLGSSDKCWKNLYLSSDGLKVRTNLPDPTDSSKFLNAKPFAIDSEGNLQIYFPSYANSKAITISDNNKITIYNPVTHQKIVSIINGFVEVFGNTSTNTYEGQIKTFSLNTNNHRIDFGSLNAKLVTAGEFVIIPEHGVFDTNSVDVAKHNRIKFGGREYTHFNIDNDSFVQEEVILSYKQAGTSTDDVPDFAVSKDGNFYYKGEKLDDVFKRLATPPSSIKDSGDNRTLTFALSKEQPAFNSIEYVAAWVGGELRKISKNTFISTSPNQTLISLQKQYARRNIGINSYLDLDIAFDCSISEELTAWNNYYLSIKNNTTSVPILYQWLEADTIYVVEICLRSLLKSNKYWNQSTVNEVFVISVPEFGGCEENLSLTTQKTLSSGVTLTIEYEQDYESLEYDDGSTEDNWWGDIILQQYKNGSQLIGDNRIYEISKIYKIGKKY